MRRGFTLVEVIIAAVIVLILSAAAIPMYNGFIKDARQDAVNELAEVAAAAANSYWRKTGAIPEITAPNTPPLNIYYDNAKHSVSIIGDSLIAEDVKYKVRKAVYFK
ncbi:hypothetical protein R80B4_00696 [Fibrobacteres bacterium R8-0-B4]